MSLDYCFLAVFLPLDLLQQLLSQLLLSLLLILLFLCFDKRRLFLLWVFLSFKLFLDYLNFCCVFCLQILQNTLVKYLALLWHFFVNFPLFLDFWENRNWRLCGEQHFFVALSDFQIVWRIFLLQTMLGVVPARWWVFLEWRLKHAFLPSWPFIVKLDWGSDRSKVNTAHDSAEIFVPVLNFVSLLYFYFLRGQHRIWLLNFYITSSGIVFVMFCVAADAWVLVHDV